MLFNTIEFLYFLPICFVLYWFFFSKNAFRQNILIIGASIYFYGYWNAKFLALLLFVTLSCYYGGYLIDYYHKKGKDRNKKLYLTLTILINILLLIYFKYFNFFVQSFVDVFTLFGMSIEIKTINIILPVGISFYIFTSLSYTIDIYRGTIQHTKDIYAYLSYALFFPCILCGPISRADDQLPQFFKKRVFYYDKGMSGVKLILWGFFMKFCVADRLGVYVDNVYDAISYNNGKTIALASFFYAIQLYADFGGYSLIAKGIGRLLGIELKDNFVRPYFSQSFSDYWQRNHISLTNWLMDYVYYPLVGTSSKLWWWNFCMIITFFISGLWHGVGFTFILWGLYQGVLIVLDSNSMRIRTRFEKKHNLKKNINWRLFKILLTFFIIYVGLIFFRANSVHDSFFAIKNIFIFSGDLLIDSLTFKYALISIPLLFIKDFYEEYYSGKLGKYCFLLRKREGCNIFYCVILLIVIIALGYFGGGKFIYFQF